MPLNGSDVATKPAGTTFAANTTIESSPMNSVIDDIYSTLNTPRSIAKGATGATTAYGAVKNMKVGQYQTKSANYTALLADLGSIFRITAASTLALTAAATLTSGWWCIVKADGGDVTVDPDSSEQINGATTLTISDGSWALISCNGTAFYALAAPTGITASSTTTFTNKSLSDSTTYFVDESDGTKKLQFQCSGITTGTTRTVTWPDLNGTVVLSTTASLSGYSWLVDEDDMVSDSAVLVPSQQSVKAYVDANPNGSVFLSTQDLSSDATADFVLPTGYDEYIFVLQNVVPATDGALLYVQTSTNGGSSYDSTAADYNTSGVFHNSSGSTSLGWGTEVASAIILTSGVGSAANEYGVSGEVTLCGAHLAKYTFLDGRLNYTNDDGNYEQAIGGGVRKSAADVDAVRFIWNGGAHESGTITAYGRKNA